MLYITKLDHPEYASNYGSYMPYVLHNGWQWHLGRFPTEAALERFLQFAGLQKTLQECKPYYEPKCGKLTTWSVDCEQVKDEYFWKKNEVPEDAKPFVGLSNGSLVDCCYLKKNGRVLTIYRPNPNAQCEVYKPLPLKEDIKYRKETGYV